MGINTTNPQGVFNIDGLKNNPTTGVPTAVQAKDDLVVTSNGNLGLGITAPGTTLDVNGAITNRETALTVAANAVTVPANVSLVRLTGAATATVAISAFAAPNPGQRLIVYNNTTGGFGATLDGVTIPNGKALEFVFSNSFWRSTDGGAAGGTTPVNIYNANGTLTGNRVVTTAGNSLAFTNGANNVTIGTTGTEGIVTAKGSSRGSFLANGGAATLSLYANDNGKAIVSAYGTSTSLDMGSSIAIPVNVFTSNTQRMTVDAGGNVGINATSPGTTLDVNGAITNRETALTVVANAVTVPANVSLVRLTGAATTNVAITAPAAPNAGQRLIVYNNTTGGFGATLDGVTVPNGKALEFVFSNSFWRSTDGGAAGGTTPVNIYNANGTLAGNRVVTTAGNSLSFTNGSNSVSVGTTGTEGIVRTNGSSRGSVLATGGGNTLSMYANDNGKAVMMTSGSTTGIDIGAATADPVNILTNNTSRITVTGAGDVGVGTTTPTNKLVVTGANAQPSALGTANTNATFRIDGNTSHALDFGTYTNAPFGSYISSHNKTSTTALPLVLNPVGGNVGVGTNTPNASALLDLNASNRGVLLPRVPLTSTTDATTVSTPATGLLLYNNNAAMAPYGTGIYYNTGTGAAPKWAKLAPQTTDYQLLDVFTDVATFPVDQAAVGTGNILDNLDLGLSLPVVIPANSTVKIIIDYTVPIGTTVSGTTQRGYYGVRFLRNGAEAQEGSRKFTITEGSSAPVTSQMVSLSGKFTETYINTNAFPVTATYTLNGYVEGTNFPVRFNMWAASGANFNWGKATMTATLFAKDN